MALELSHGLILISIPPCRRITQLKMTKTAYLSSRAINQKNKNTLPSSTFKDGEGKVPLLFSYLAQELRYSHFLIFKRSFQLKGGIYIKKLLQLGFQSKSKKSKGTLLSSTFKVEEGKVPLLFSYSAQELRYAVFIISSRAIHLQGGIDIRIWP